jgi:transcriptional regulator with GAF, ATPase, and Fis domain
VAPDRAGELLESLAIAARQLQGTGSIDDLLQKIVDLAVDAVPGCAYAGVSTERNGRPNSPVVSDPAVLAIDSLQYSLGTGPCLHAMRGPDVLVEAPDLEHDPRFDPFGAEAAKADCRAVMAHRLYVDGSTLGSLNLYAREVQAYTEESRRSSVVLSGLASLALNMIRLDYEGEGLREAVQSRDVIGQAKGLLMARDGVTGEEAFETLRTTSQDQNIKLRTLAQQIVDEHQATSG